MSGARQGQSPFRRNRQIAERTAALAKEIAAAEPKDLLVVAILKGSFMFAADLLRALHRVGLEPQVEFFHLSSYREGTVSSGTVKILRDIESSVKGRDVLLVDDILESGRTLAFAKDLLVARGARRVLVCTLLEKPGKREVPIDADFVGFVCPDVFVVGYGMDVAHCYRELPFIGHVVTGGRRAVKGAASASSRADLPDLSPSSAGPRTAPRASRLCARELAARGLAGFIVPRADEHQNEYVPAAAERLLWLTGFCRLGGPGDRAARQGGAVRRRPLHGAGGRRRSTSVIAVNIRRRARRPPGSRPISNPATRWATIRGCTRRTAVERLAKACAKAGGELVAVESQPDRRDLDRPAAAPLGADSTPAASGCAGERAAAKLARVGAALAGKDGLLVSDAHNVAWLFNIRGGDVAHTPLPLGFAYAAARGPTDPVRRRTQTLRCDARSPRPPRRDRDAGAARRLRRRLGAAGARVAFDAATAPARLTQALEAAGGKAALGADPITLMKAVKNPAELAGTRAAHVRDGAAMARFLAWFDREAPSREA